MTSVISSVCRGHILSRSRCKEEETRRKEATEEIFLIGRLSNMWNVAFLFSRLSQNKHGNKNSSCCSVAALASCVPFGGSCCWPSSSTGSAHIIIAFRRIAARLAYRWRFTSCDPYLSRHFTGGAIFLSTVCRKVGWFIALVAHHASLYCVLRNHAVTKSHIGFHVSSLSAQQTGCQTQTP